MHFLSMMLTLCFYFSVFFSLDCRFSSFSHTYTRIVAFMYSIPIYFLCHSVTLSFFNSHFIITTLPLDFSNTSTKWDFYCWFISCYSGNVKFESYYCVCVGPSRMRVCVSHIFYDFKIKSVSNVCLCRQYFLINKMIVITPGIVQIS